MSDHSRGIYNPEMIRPIYLAAGLTRAEAAARLGWSWSRMLAVERGDYELNPLELRGFREVIGGTMFQLNMKPTGKLRLMAWRSFVLERWGV